MVAENMLADVLSDLGGTIIGGMGMTPTGEIGENHAFFQPAHVSASDIAGTGKANPTGNFLSAAIMLDWLGEPHKVPGCLTAGQKLETTIETGFRSGKIRPMEFGGPHRIQNIEKGLRELIEA